jgi:hypothetical protein
MCPAVYGSDRLSTGVHAKYAPKFRTTPRLPYRVLNPLLSALLPAMQTLGVDLVQHLQGVSGPLGVACSLQNPTVGGAGRKPPECVVKTS